MSDPSPTGDNSLYNNTAMVRICTQDDAQAIYAIVNEAAVAYKGHIPDDCYAEPYMSWAELVEEMRCMTFHGWEEGGTLLGVMGYQPVEDVTLVRHAYVLPDHQGRGIGSALLAHVERLTTTTRLLVGTWADATWAIGFYERRGFRLLPDKDDLLRRYWSVAERQREVSVVLGKELARP